MTESSGPAIDTSTSDPFSSVDADELRSTDNLKWTRCDDDVLPAWIADMDAPMCPAVRDALIDAIATAGSAGSFGYPSDELFESAADAFVERYQSRHGWSPSVDGVTLVTDILGGVTRILGTVAEPGDGVVLQTPVYPPFLEQAEAMNLRIHHHGAKWVESKWQWDPDELESMIDARTRAIVLVNPQNPTGRAFDRKELIAVAEVAERHDLVVISDEVHCDVIFDTQHIPFASISDDAAARTVTFTSATKAFNLAGMRCAVAHYGDPELRQRVENLPHSAHGEVSNLGIMAMVAAWTHGDPWLEDVLAALAMRREVVEDFLTEHLPEVGHSLGQATYLAWLDFSALDLGPDPSEFFLERARVMLGSGPAFGPNGIGRARLNLATSAAILTEILERMVTAVDLHRASN